MAPVLDSQALQAENEALREQLRYYREYDQLTGLYNKNTFYQRVEDLLRQRPEERFVLAGVDVERFKLINDLYGTERGDDLLRYVAQALSEAFGRDGIVARLGNDVFALCLPASREQEAEDTILRIFRDAPLDMAVIPAMGFYRITDPTVRPSLMCDWALAALKSAKGNYLKHAAVYESALRSDLLEEHLILNSMDAALANHEFKLYFQPKCNMHTGLVVGAEALVRWEHPQRGLISPGDFIPIFERNGFIKKLDAYIWEETAAWLRRWLDAGHPATPVSVNISRIDVYEMDVCQVLLDLLGKYSLDPRLLELEITESAYAEQPELIIQTMERLMGHGFTVLMDDFGSGYSSLNMLKDISVDILKIDMGFLERDDQKSKDILESVVRMSKWLNMPVIAEGVESQRQVDFLLGIGCMYAQGFLYYRPMPIPDFEALLLDRSRVDFRDQGHLQLRQDVLLDFHDLFHKDSISDRLLGNLLGAIALYAYDGVCLSLLRGTEAYYRLTGDLGRTHTMDINLMDLLNGEDRALLHRALLRAKSQADEDCTEVCVRQDREGHILWAQLRLFHLAVRNGQDIFYAAVTDVTEHMEAMDRLRISEQRFRLAMEATNIVLFELDVKTRTASYSEYAQRVYGLNATVANAPEGFIQQGTVYPGYEDTFRSIWTAIYEGAPRASCVIRALAGKEAVWNRITLIAIRDQEGRTAKAIGMVETLSRAETLEPGL